MEALDAFGGVVDVCAFDSGQTEDNGLQAKFSKWLGLYKTDNSNLLGWLFTEPVQGL